MPGCRTAQLSTVTMASARWRASPGRTSCRSRALVTSCTASSPAGTRWPRWPRRCWAQRSARWRSPTTARTVSAVGCPCVLRLHVHHMTWSCCSSLALKCKLAELLKLFHSLSKSNRHVLVSFLALDLQCKNSWKPLKICVTVWVWFCCVLRKTDPPAMLMQDT